MPDQATTDLLARYDVRLPRYTSYPTAPHFTTAVDGAVYGGWLGPLTGEAPVSLYLHVPFCQVLCWYCGCHTHAINSPKPAAEYAGLLRREIALVAETIGRRLPAASLHWGGGTPTMLADADFAAIMGDLAQAFAYTADAERAIELDPRGVDEARISGLAAQGINRASLGVQDFAPEVQQAINRIQPYEQTAAVVGWLRAAGIRRVNLDLMYGLPLQTVASVVETVDRAASLAPDRIALFGYAHVPWMKKHQKLLPEAALPGMGERFDQAEAAARRLVEHGYVPVGLDHFAKADDPMVRQLESGRLARNFQGYTTDESPVLIGLGASSIGRLPQGYAQNTPDLPSYRQAMAEGRLATARGLALTAEDRLRASVIERIMCDLAVDLAAVAAAHGTAPGHFAADLERLEPLVADGLARRDGWRIMVTERGRPLVRAVAAAFDAYLECGAAPGALRHSRAV